MSLSIFYVILTASLLLTKLNIFAGAQGVGVNFGRVADNLPPPEQVIALVKSNNIQRIRLFDPNPDILNVLKGTEIQVILGVVNNDLPALATNPGFPITWVQTNVVPFASGINFRAIAVGNEIIFDKLAQYIVPAMQGLQAALKAANLNIPLSIALEQSVLSASSPPSAGTLNPVALPIVQFLQANNYPLLLNSYLYFAYINDPDHIRLDYALLNTTEIVVQDGSFGYTNLFDASIDAMYAALENAGAGNIEVIVSETGWPSDGDDPAIMNVINAQTYINNLINRLKANVATPRRPGKGVETYIFALFNEDLKPAGREQHFGLFYPNMTQVYPLNLQA